MFYRCGADSDDVFESEHRLKGRTLQTRLGDRAVLHVAESGGEMAPSRYAILASVIASRSLEVEPTHNGPTYTDGRTIFVAAATDPGDVRDAVVMQAALLAGGSLEKQRMTELSRRRHTVAQRYLALELGRVARQLEHLLPGRTLRRVESSGLQPVSLNSEESLRCALSRQHIPPTPAWAGTLQPGRLRRVDRAGLCASPTDADLEHFDELREMPLQSDDDADDDTEESKILKLFSTPVKPNAISNAIARFLGMGRGKPDKNQGSGEIPVAKQSFGPVGRNARKGRFSGMLSAVLEPAPMAGIRYPEWDCHKGAYRSDWCTVAEYAPAVVETASEGIVVSGSSLRRPLARVGIEPERHRLQLDGDTLDLSALVDYETDRRRGELPVANIYESSRLTRRELSALVLLDCSGSTAEASSGHVVFEEERRLAGDLTAALELLGDRIATYGFYSQGKDAVRFLRIKEFTARFDTAAKRRLRSVQPSGFTRVGAAIRHSTHVLESQALAKNMVLVVIGDGLPYDGGYEGRYARADARQAIQETMLRGIGVVGVGIRSSTEPEVLEDVWSDASFRVIGQSEDIQRHLRGLLLGALCRVRSNGRRRELLTEQHQMHLRSLNATRRRTINTYV